MSMRFDLDPKIKQALSYLINKNNPSWTKNRCVHAVEDALENGPDSVYWDEVSAAAKGYFGPILDLLAPVIQQIFAGLVPAISIRADEINREAEAGKKDERHDAGDSGT